MRLYIVSVTPRIVADFHAHFVQQGSNVENVFGTFFWLEIEFVN